MYIILTYKTKNYALYCFYGNINVVVVVTLIRASLYGAMMCGGG